MSLVRQSMWAASAGLVMTASRFIVTAILARKLSVDAFGQFVYSQWLVDIGFLVCALGATGVASRYFSEYRENPSALAAVAQRWRPLSFVLPLFGALAAVSGAGISGLTFSVDAYVLLASWCLMSGLWGMHTAALTGLQRFDLVFTANVVAAVTMLIGVWLVPFDEDGSMKVFGIMAVAAGLASCVGLRPIALVIKIKADELSPERWGSIYRYAFNIWITAIMWSLVWSRGEIPVLRNLEGDEAVGTYAVALTLYGGAVAGVMLWISGIAQQITRYLGERNEQAALTLCRFALDLQLLLIGVGALVLIWLAPELIELGFGVKYQGSAVLLGILALGLPAMALASCNHLLQIITDARYSRNTTIFGVFLLFCCSWVGVSLLGVPGAALSRSSTLLIMGAITYFVFWRRWGLGVLGGFNISVVILLLGVSVLFSLLPELKGLPVRLALCVGMIALLLVLMKTKSKEPLVISVWLRVLSIIGRKSPNE
ncbi:MAG: lipopolysaccharide biosynthesis protein [Porticoccaceae bacterium]|nr:lipopolysaccharide biosynthesis protein [Porticoccaceae bacterium]